jgi:8-oxo-dGTP pyrophosphatase MutT (NUDIX family)
LADWKTKSSEVVYETPWLKVRRDEVVDHNGKPLTYSVVSLHHPSVFIVALNQAGELLLQKQYRYTVDSEMWELPAGHSDGQDLLSAAKRELLEETGLESSSWTSLGTYYQADGIGNIATAFFLAEDVASVSDDRDEDEDISAQRFVPIDELEQMIRDGKIECMPVVTGLHLAQLHQKVKEK